MMKWKIGLGLMAMLAVSSSVQAEPYVENVGGGTLNWTTGMMEATGIGVAPDRYLNNPGRARAMAIRAAKTTALRNLLEQTQGVKVTSATLTKDFAIESDLVRTTMTGVVKGATMVGKPHYMEDGSVEVKMAINYREKIAPMIVDAYLDKVEADLAASSAPVVRPLIETMPAVPVMQSAAPTTGLIIDALGLGLRTALAPQVFDEDGNVVYGGSVVVEAKQGDMVAYDTSPVDAARLARVGENPVTIKALKVEGLTNIVISNEDAAKLMKLAGMHDVLRNAHVAFAL